MKKDKGLPTTTRASWARGVFKSVEDFMNHLEAGNTDGLELIFDDETGEPYIDEGECTGPFAGDD